MPRPREDVDLEGDELGRQRHHVVTRVEERRNEATADEPRRARDQHAHVGKTTADPAYYRLYVVTELRHPGCRISVHSYSRQYQSHPGVGGAPRSSSTRSASAGSGSSSASAVHSSMALPPHESAERTASRALA